MTDAGGDNSPSLPNGPIPAPKRSRAGVFVSWALIAASVLLIVGINQIESHLPAAVEGNGVGANVPMEMMARYVIGSNHLLAQAGPGAIDTKAAFMTQLDQIATSTADRLREVMVAGELEGGAEALDRIGKLQSRLHDPAFQADITTVQKIYTTGPASLTAQQRQDLADRYGWFGRLALSYRQPSSDPDRREAMQKAVRGFAAMAALVVTIVIAIFVGLVLFIIALVRYADGKIHPAYVPSRGDTAPFLATFAIYLVGNILIGLLVGRLSGHMHLNFAYLLAACVPVGLALVWPLWRGVSFSDWRVGLGWHAGTGVFREIFWGISTYVAGLPLIAVGALVTLVLAKLSGAQTMHPIVNQAAEPGAALRLFLLAAVFAPLAEESVFRGALFHHLRSRHGWWVSAVVVSLLFAAIHPQGWAAIPTLGMIAMTFAAIREWRGTIIASAAAHALNNAAVLTVLIIATS